MTRSGFVDESGEQCLAPCRAWIGSRDGPSRRVRVPRDEAGERVIRLTQYGTVDHQAEGLVSAIEFVVDWMFFDFLAVK